MIPDPNTNANVAVCHRCKFSQSTRKGGCAGDCQCHANGKDIIDNARAGKCPKGLFPVLDQATRALMMLAQAIHGAAQPVTAPVVEQWGPAAWEELHTAKDADEAWLMSWSRRIPCGACATHWTAAMEEIPPVFGDGWFEWTWRAHNAINVRLGKAEISIEESRARWAGC